MTISILLVDPGQEEASALSAYLATHGVGSEVTPGGEAALRRVAATQPRVVVLHRRVRSEPDLGLLRRLRAVSAAPMILRAMDADDEVDRVLALEIGADDYLRQDTSPREVLARIRCLLRRGRSVVRGEAPTGWKLCLRRRELFAPDGEPRHLTSAEFELLQTLARQQGMTVPRDALSLGVLRRPYHSEDRALDNLVLRLRRKLGGEEVGSRLIKSVRGVGYVFVGFDAAMPQALAEVIEAPRPALAS
jgi:DNA-binding response OmpR family regulator